jgi:hypothetical protein
MIGSNWKAPALFAVAIGLQACVPAVSVVEGLKQLGSYGVEQAFAEEDKYLKNYSDRRVCLSATLENREWDESVAAEPFVREAGRRDIGEDCRNKYTTP